MTKVEHSGLIDKKITIENRVSTLLVAKAFDITHQEVMTSINTYKKHFKTLSKLLRPTTKEEVVTCKQYILNEDHIILLGMLLDNLTPEIIEFKKAAALQFRWTRSKVRNDKSDSPANYLINRDAQILLTNQTYKILKKFGKYIDKQNDNGALYIDHITKMLNILLFISKAELHNLERVMSATQFLILSTVEKMIHQHILEGINNKMLYKDIYKALTDDFLQFEESNQATNGPIHSQLVHLTEASLED
jgi:phage regulator Rha-like protein